MSLRDAIGKRDGLEVCWANTVGDSVGGKTNAGVTPDTGVPSGVSNCIDAI